jgi:hypothetical protein
LYGFGAVGVDVELEEEGMAWGSCADDAWQGIRGVTGNLELISHHTPCFFYFK